MWFNIFMVLFWFAKKNIILIYFLDKKHFKNNILNYLYAQRGSVSIIMLL